MDFIKVKPENHLEVYVNVDSISYFEIHPVSQNFELYLSGGSKLFCRYDMWVSSEIKDINLSAQQILIKTVESRCLNK